MRYLRQFGRWCQDKIYIVDHHDVLAPEEAIQLVIDSKRLYWPRPVRTGLPFPGGPRRRA